MFLSVAAGLVGGLLVGACIAAPAPVPVPAAGVVPTAPPRVKSPRARNYIDPSVPAGLREIVEGRAPAGPRWLGPLQANGGRPVLIYIAAGASSGAAVREVFHFHGTYAEHIEIRREGLAKRLWVGADRLTQTMEAIDELQTTTEDTVVLVYPLSAGKRRDSGLRGWTNQAYDRRWMDAEIEPFDQLRAAVLKILREELGVHSQEHAHTVIAEAHSAGGIALRNIAQGGSSQVDHYLFLDASFQGWADGCREATRASKDPAQVVLVVTRGGIADPLQGRDPWCAVLEHDHRIWEGRADWCVGRAHRRPPGSERDCRSLEENAQQWSKYDLWCQSLGDGMQADPGVTLIWTQVVHAQHPRRFAGGLGLESLGFEHQNEGAKTLETSP